MDDHAYDPCVCCGTLIRDDKLSEYCGECGEPICNDCLTDKAERHERKCLKEKQKEWKAITT